MYVCVCVFVCWPAGGREGFVCLCVLAGGWEGGFCVCVCVCVCVCALAVGAIFSTVTLKDSHILLLSFYLYQMGLCC